MALLGQSRESWRSMAPLGHVENLQSKCYGTSRPSKRELTIYGTSRPRGFNKNAMALLGQSRDSWPSMAPLGHVELTKMQKLLESKNKNKNQNQNENKNENSLFSFSFFVCFHFCFCFQFHFFCFHFRFWFCFSFSFIFSFYF